MLHVGKYFWPMFFYRLKKGFIDWIFVREVKLGPFLHLNFEKHEIYLRKPNKRIIYKFNNYSSIFLYIVINSVQD